MERSKVRRSLFRPRSLDDYNKARLGAVAIVAVAVVLAALLVVNSMSIGDKQFDAEFAQAAQIRAGDPVTVAGVDVGKVSGLRFDGDHVTVSMKIHDDIPLGADTRAAIKLTTLLGSRYVELRPAGSGNLPDGRVPLANTAVPYDLQSALGDATTTFEQVDATRLGDTLTSLSNQLSGSPSLIPAALDNVKTLSKVIADRRDQLGSLLTSTSQITQVVEDQQANIGSLMGQGRDLLNELNARRSTIEHLLNSTTDLVSRLQHLVIDDQPQIQQLIDSLNTFLAMLARNDGLFRSMLEILPVPMRNFANASGSADEVDFNVPAGAMYDSWMCALSGHAKEVQLAQYFKDCK